jgi:hypothetical protein
VDDTESVGSAHGLIALLHSPRGVSGASIRAQLSAFVSSSGSNVPPMPSGIVPTSAPATALPEPQVSRRAWAWRTGGGRARTRTAVSAGGAARRAADNGHSLFAGRRSLALIHSCLPSLSRTRPYYSTRGRCSSIHRVHRHATSWRCPPGPEDQPIAGPPRIEIEEHAYDSRGKSHARPASSVWER